MAATRVEKDFLGQLELPAGQLHGINTVRGVENLTVSTRTLGAEREFARAFARCKWAAALANAELELITARQRDAIVQACREMADGAHDRELVVDLLEGSGGTSTNMNVNEVLANRAQQILGGALGRYDLVHPNDHVNRSQSTNDVYPTAMKLAVHALLAPLIAELDALARALAAKAKEFAGILHLGRTCLQDAQPMTLAQPFEGYAAVTARQAGELQRARAGLTALPLGGTAIGTGFGAVAGYRMKVFAHLNAICGDTFVPAACPFDAMQNLDAFARVSSELRTAATSIAKIASDLILLSSGPRGGIAELALPAVQAGSSIMPGKVNPVVPMSLVQIGFAVVGNDTCVAQANQAGQLEINHFEPVVADRVFDSIRLLRNGARLLREKCVEGLRADAAANERHLLESTAIATALIPRLGYAKVSELVRESVASGRPFLALMQERGLLGADEARTLVLESTRVVG
jgi:aspartate ammonia-lyase